MVGVEDVDAAVAFRLPVALVSPQPPVLVGLELKQAVALRSLPLASRAEENLAAAGNAAVALAPRAAESYLR